ncbi:hypothetical protein J2W42_002375 [Rhizobium tibeticum]|nr:hypothetical protein [Rhizobium tibeticum]
MTGTFGKAKAQCARRLGTVSRTRPQAVVSDSVVSPCREMSLAQAPWNSLIGWQSEHSRPREMARCIRASDRYMAGMNYRPPDKTHNAQNTTRRGPRFHSPTP